MVVEVNNFYVGDSRIILNDLRLNEPFIDLIITSPPYWDMKNYGGTKNQIGFGQDKQNYLEDIRKVFSFCFDLTRKNGSIWTVVDSFRRNGEIELLPFELGEILKSIGWTLREVIIWDKQYGLPWHQKGQMRNTTEYILFASKTDKYKFYIDRIKQIDEISKWWVDFPERYYPKGKTPTNIWSFPIRRRGTWPIPSLVNHLCPFPTKLVSRIIELTTDVGDIVFDPFAGSGVVLATASVMNRKYVGIEINPKYLEMYKNEVIPTVMKEWKDIQYQRKKMEETQNDFEQTVMRLRVLKYSRHAIDAFVEKLEEEQKSKLKAGIVLCALPDSFDRNLSIDVEIWLLGEKKHKFMKGCKEFAERRLRKVPLSHYGVKGIIKTASFESFYDNFKEFSEIFFLYPYKKTRSYINKGSLENYFKNQNSLKKYNGGTLPMLSNIEVDSEWVVK